MTWDMQQHRKNREAEEAYVRKTVWGAENKQTGDGNDDMGDVYLGDITITAPDDHSQAGVPAKKAASGLASMALAAILPTAAAAGLAGYLLNSGNDPAPEVSGEYDNLQIGLGKIEDYIK